MQWRGVFEYPVIGFDYCIENEVADVCRQATAAKAIDIIRCGDGNAVTEMKGAAGSEIERTIDGNAIGAKRRIYKLESASSETETAGCIYFE